MNQGGEIDQAMTHEDRVSAERLEHTKTPWVVVADIGDAIWIGSPNDGNTGMYVAKLYGPDRQANAHFILAAVSSYSRNIEAIEKERDDAIDALNSAWSKHGSMEIAKGQWEARALAAEARLEALSPIPETQAVTVKPLLWSTWGSDRHTAKPFGAEYSIRFGGALVDGAFDLEINSHTARKGGFSTLEKAKAAAQADYETRILSALQGAS